MISLHTHQGTRTNCAHHKNWKGVFQEEIDSNYYSETSTMRNDCLSYGNGQKTCNLFCNITVKRFAEKLSMLCV